MNRKCLMIAGATFLVLTKCGLCQSHPERSSLCELQKSAVEGEHREVRVKGVYLEGLEGAYLAVAHCSGLATFLDFGELKDHKNVNRLHRMADKPNAVRGVYGDEAPVLVVFEGEFYGPPVPNQRLPEPIKRIYYPGWDNNAKTKLVVHAILSVRELPAGDPCKPPKSNPTDWPCFQKD